jgi:hypothetical protein
MIFLNLLKFFWPLTKSALRITAVKSLEKIDCLSVASFEFFLDFQGYLADFSQALIFGYFSSRKSNRTLDKVSNLSEFLSNSDLNYL